jgi:hypothetical protein
MKFFSNLPKITFSSSIGNFTVSNFFTYLNVENIFLDVSDIVVDNKNTLVEAGYNTYTDPNTIWSFLAANDTINPFDLLAENTVLFEEENQQKINFLLFPTQGATVGGSAFPIGSIVIPYVGNTGGTATYGSTGNFNLNSPFTRIQNTLFYDGSMTSGKQFGGTSSFITTGTTYDQIVVLNQNSDGSYSWGGVFYTSNKTAAPDAVVYIEGVKGGETIIRQVNSSNITIDELFIDSSPIDYENAKLITAKEFVDNTSKTIKAYPTNTLGTLRSSFITAKYN